MIILEIIADILYFISTSIVLFAGFAIIWLLAGLWMNTRDREKD